MSDNDLIRRGDALYAIAGWEIPSTAIAALPAVTVGQVERMQNLIDAYEDIMDYGIVFAKREQQDRLKAAKEKLE